MSLVWGGNVSAVCAIFRSFEAHNLPPRKLFFYGFTIGHTGIGIILSRRVKK